MGNPSKNSLYLVRVKGLRPFKTPKIEYFFFLKRKRKKKKENSFSNAQWHTGIYNNFDVYILFSNF